MAVIGTLSKGYDLDYIWKQVDRTLAGDPAGYYIQASERGGEPPGRWWGPAAKTLGLEPGQVVERKPYDLLFGRRQAPDGTQLGSRSAQAGKLRTSTRVCWPPSRTRPPSGNANSGWRPPVERETAFAAVMEDRADWERATRRQRQLAVAADGELRRRHPAEPWPPLRSAEPAAVAEAENNDLTVAEDITQRIRDLAARHREFADRLAERQSLIIPAEDPDFRDLGPAFRAWKATERGAILRPPPPEIIPFERAMEGVAGRDMDIEAGT